MGIIKKISWTISVLFACLVIYGGLYVYSLYHVEILDVSISNLGNTSQSGFTVEGEILLRNGGLLGVEISSINYSLILDKTGTELASGMIEGSVLAAKKNASFSFSEEVEWVPTAELAQELLTSKEVNATLSGKVYLSDFRLFGFNIPFEEKIDLGPYVRQFLKDKAEEAAEKAAEKIGGGLGDLAGKVISGIADLLD